MTDQMVIDIGDASDLSDADLLAVRSAALAGVYAALWRLGAA